MVFLTFQMIIIQLDVTVCNITVTVTETTQYLATQGGSIPDNYRPNQPCPFNFEAPTGRTIVISFDFGKLYKN